MPWQFEKPWMALRIGRDANRQVTAALEWVGGIAQPDDGILVEFPRYRRCFYLSISPRYNYTR